MPSVELVVEKRDDLGKGARADAEGALDQPGFVEHVAG